MHDMERLIAQWREAMATQSIGHETLDELENHLRETTDELIRSGVNEMQAFERAVAQLGPLTTIASEFQKLNQTTWLPVKVVIGVWAALPLALMTWLFTHYDNSRSSLLLAVHVFTVTMGYTTTLFAGGLGICFVCQRCLLEFSPVRLQSIGRFTFNLICTAICLTAVGIFLGMVWARIEWGRFWDWDPKETGAMCVIVWQICFLAAYRRATTRGLLLLSILGNIIVTFAWFGANLIARTDSYGPTNYAVVVLAAAILHLTFFLIGFAPPGWLRLRRA